MGLDQELLVLGGYHAAFGEGVVAVSGELGLAAGFDVGEGWGGEGGGGVRVRGRD